MTTWVIAGAVGLVALIVFVRARGGSGGAGAPAWYDQARCELLRDAIARRAPDARVAPKPPVPLPDLRLPLDWQFRTRAGAEAGSTGARWLAWDAEHRQRAPAGCNMVMNASGEDAIVRHTVVAILDDRLALPHFTLLPNVGAALARAMPERFRDAGLGDSRLAGLATRAAAAMTRLEAPGDGMAFPGRPGFVDAFRVTADDEAATRAIVDETVTALLLRHPWAIVEGRGSCLVVSRNVADAYRTRDELPETGWLSAESVDEVVTLAGELADAWRKPRPS
ncbi:MAG: hypothetical protein R2752_05505 [Vicinamibacterales bacterium]